jgi:hypothetical protein
MLAGKRVGPAEIESMLVDDPDVVEAAAVGVPDTAKGEALVCFVVLAAGADEPSALPRLADSIAAREGKATRPKAVHAVAALPKTRNGKVLRRVARAAYLGQDPGDLTALKSPAPLAAFAALSRPAPPPSLHDRDRFARPGNSAEKRSRSMRLGPAAAQELALGRVWPGATNRQDHAHQHRGNLPRAWAWAARTPWSGAGRALDAWGRWDWRGAARRAVR